MQAASAGIAGITLLVVLIWIVRIVLFAGAIFLAILAFKALSKYLNEDRTPAGQTQVRKSLGEAIKERRTALQMTQEFVAEQLGVSRQAVSKWENGTSDPSTPNLFALARLFGISVEELLRNVTAE